MNNDTIQNILTSTLPLQEIYVSGDDKHFQIIAVSEIFDGMSSVKKHQMIYTPLIEYISNNHIHALSIKAYTPQEWKTNCKLDILVK